MDFLDMQSVDYSSGFVQIRFNCIWDSWKMTWVNLQLDLKDGHIGA